MLENRQNRLVLHREARVRTGFPRAFHQPRLRPGFLVLPDTNTFGAAPAAGSVRRALVVDDEPTIRTALARDLRLRRGGSRRSGGRENRPPEAGTFRSRRIPGGGVGPSDAALLRNGAARLAG